MVAIEVAGTVFGIFMLYMTYVSFRKRQLNAGDMAFWGVVWTGVIVFALFSPHLQPSIELIGFIRVLDLLLIIGFAVLFAVIFFLFKKTRVLERKTDELVEKIMLGKK